jgi:hypothetical protein
MTATAAPTPMLYVDCDVPEGMTLSEWRSQRRQADEGSPRRTGLARFVRRGR